jgi:hypothetical protein
MTITRTYVLLRSSPASTLTLELCHGATGLVFTSTGGSCTWNPVEWKIECTPSLAGLQLFYACQIMPTVRGGYLDVPFYWWTDFPEDRLVDIYYPPQLAYDHSTLAPALAEAGHLRYVQFDAGTGEDFDTTVTFRIPVLYIPLVGRN